MRWQLEGLATFGLGLVLPITSGCSNPVPDDDTAGDETSGASESDENEETTDESTDEETGADETEGNETEDDPDPSKPCTWSHFPSQYGINVGQDCGQLGYFAAAEDFESVFTCLQDAYDAEQAAHANATLFDLQESTYKYGWYVRPPKGDNPRWIETSYYQQYVEEGSPTGQWKVRSCSNFDLDLERCADFAQFCTACVQPVTIICGEKED